MSRRPRTVGYHRNIDQKAKIYVCRTSGPKEDQLQQETKMEALESMLDSHARSAWRWSDLHAAPKKVSLTAKLGNDYGALYAKIPKVYYSYQHHSLKLKVRSAPTSIPRKGKKDRQRFVLYGTR